MQEYAEIFINKNSASNIETAEIPKINNNSIYHYTSPEAFINIIKNKKLWFTNIRFLNDKMEFCCGLEVMLNCIKQIDKNISDEKLSNIKNDIIKSGNSYVACFSKDRDNLGLWNYYTRNMNNYGYNICFNLNNLIKCIIKNKNLIGFHVIFGEILYNLEEYKVHINNLINGSKSPLKCNIYQYDSIYNKFINFSMNELPFIKHESYSSESEIRILLECDKKHLDKEKLLFRNNNGIITPYIEVDIDINAIKGVTLSPGIKDDIAIEGIKKLLTKNDIKLEQLTMGIKQSKIPLRF
ncbi:MAG: DUF2971 domain-containing protein [Clostridia bacterium]|nr:DUF2971 domain-containing protein [Clostridia bacterium]